MLNKLHRHAVTTNDIPLEIAIDAVQADGAQAYLEKFDETRLVEMINERLPEDIKQAVLAQMIDEMAAEDRA